MTQDSIILKGACPDGQVVWGRDLARIFITGCPNWDFKDLGCPKSLIVNIKIITLIMHIIKSSNYMFNSS